MYHHSSKADQVHISYK